MDIKETLIEQSNALGDIAKKITPTDAGKVLVTGAAIAAVIKILQKALDSMNNTSN